MAQTSTVMCTRIKPNPRKSKTADIKRARRNILERALQEKGLMVRMDGFLCTSYIKRGDTPEWPLETVVRRMCEIRYLYDYTAYSVVYEMLREREDAQYLSKLDIQKRAETIILNHLPGKTWPAQWPWIATYASIVKKSI